MLRTEIIRTVCVLLLGLFSEESFCVLIKLFSEMILQTCHDISLSVFLLVRIFSSELSLAHSGKSRIGITCPIKFSLAPGNRAIVNVQPLKGKARESIEDCILLKPDVGYRRAVDILRDQFGQPHVICHSLLEKVLNRPQIRPNDGVALWALARVMRKCQITVEQMGYGANLDSTDTLLKIQHILPIYLQSGWATRAYDVIVSGVDPRFLHMVEFVEKAAKSANSMYGANIGKCLKEERQKQRET